MEDVMFNSNFKNINELIVDVLSSHSIEYTIDNIRCDGKKNTIYSFTVEDNICRIDVLRHSIDLVHVLTLGKGVKHIMKSTGDIKEFILDQVTVSDWVFSINE